MQSQSNQAIKAILIPGNGGGIWKDLLRLFGRKRDNWFPYVKRELRKIGIEVLAPRFPDAFLAREKYWLPFLKKLGADENTILIGHSSGAVAAMRYAEQNKILGSVLVAPCYTDLNIETEKLSGYYDHPWHWERIRANQKWIIEFASRNDPFIPIEEARFIHEKLGSEYFEHHSSGHFSSWDRITRIPEMITALKRRLQPASSADAHGTAAVNSQDADHKIEN